MNCRRFLAAFVALLVAQSPVIAADKPLKVFVLAGQSNMQGHARVSTIDSLADDPKTAPLLKEMLGPDGKPKVCENVWITSVGGLGDAFTDLKEKKGKLTVGYGAPGDKIGPEFTFGVTMEKLLGEPVLLVKTAWGGRSLHTDFRPPSAGPYVWSENELGRHRKRGDDLEKLKAEKAKATGVYYRETIAHVRKVLQDIKRVVPDYDPKQGYEIAGFVWFQGFNDYVGSSEYPDRDNPGGYDLYSELLAHLIRDVRKDLAAPKLPFVIGVMGIDGLKGNTKAPMMHFRAAQRKPATLDEFKGNVFAVETAPFWDDDLAAIDAKRGKVSQMGHLLRVKNKNAANKDGKMTKEDQREYLKKYEADLITPAEAARWKRGASNGGYHYLGAAKILAPIGKAFAEALVNRGQDVQPQPQAQAPDKPRYNVLLVMADDLRPALNCYGDKRAKTPNLDRLAARGVRFDRAYVQYPVCNPSRTSMLTGTRPEKNGVVGNNTFFRDKLPDAVTLPQLFRRHGATAVSYGKIYHAGLVEGETENRFLDAGKSWDEAKMFRPTKVGNAGTRRNLTGGKLKWCEVADLEGTDDDQSDGQTAQATVAAMERFAERRWFVGAGFHRPHDPFVVNKNYVAQFPAGSLALHRDPADASPLAKHALGGGAFAEAFKKFDDRDRMDFLTHYYAGVTQTDAQVGRLMDALDRLKLWDKTVVVFVGDHGYHLGERGWWNKATLFERSCRTPFLLVAPGVKPAVCRSLVEFLDIYRTVADLCGLPVPDAVKGKSLQPLLADPTKSVHDSALTYVTRGPRVSGYGLRTDRWRYIEWSDGGAELYDHTRDPEEWHNVAGESANAEALVDLRKALAARR